MLIGIDGIGKSSSDTARDTARIAGQVISGIGFLGAGTILQKRMAYQVLLQLQLCGYQEQFRILRGSNHRYCDMLNNLNFIERN